MELKQKTVQGLFWTFGQQVSVHLIAVVVQVVLARLLLPESFGLIAMLSIFIAIGITLMDSGMTSSLIRSNEADECDYSTVFIMNLAFSLLVYFLLFLAAPWISAFYDHAQLTPILRVFSLTIIIQAFSSVQVTRLTKTMDFKKQMLFELPAILIGSILGIVLALMGYGVWSLVWMYLVRALILSILYWVYIPWRPLLILDSKKFRQHFNFGYKLTLAGLLDTIYTNSYNVVIGKFFPVQQLGYYDRAVTFRNLPVNTISTALFKVTYPLFSGISDQPERLKAVFRQTMQQVIYLVAPLMIGLVIIAEPAFRWVLTEKWVPAVPYFQVLCLAGILYPLNAFNLNILNVKGRSDIFLRLEFIKKIVAFGLLIIALPYGIIALVFTQVISSAFGFIMNAIYSGRQINYALPAQVTDMLPVLILTAGCGLATWLLSIYFFQLFELADPFMIMLQAGFFFILYVGGSYLLQFRPFLEYRNLIFNR